MRFGLLLLVLLAVIGGMCIACQGHTETSLSTKAIDPCELVSQADARSFLGVPVKPPIRTDVMLMASGHECHYIASAPTASPYVTWGIVIVVYDNTTVDAHDSSMFKNATDYFHRDMAALQSSGTMLVPIQHLGNEAYWQPGPDLLHVLDHGVYIMLDVDADFHMPPAGANQTGQPFDSAKRAAEITLAQDIILPRLEQAQSASLNSQPTATGSGRHTS